MKKMAGFTLIELMLVVGIIGILAAVAIPSYQDYVLRGRLTDAFSTLSPYQARMEQYYQDNRMYSNGAGSTTCGVPPPPNSTHFNFSCAPTNGGQGFTATATGNSGSVSAFTFSVDDTGAKSTVVASGGPSGWTGSGTCWVRNKGGAC